MRPEQGPSASCGGNAVRALLGSSHVSKSGVSASVPSAVVGQG